jgi:DNA-binding PadR family transcriptional regulator
VSRHDGRGASGPTVKTPAQSIDQERKQGWSILPVDGQSCLTTRMNSVRLFVLGALAQGGPMHGHQIRRAAQTDRTELWTDVKPGSLYGALHRMELEGLIRAVRTEQKGNRPARTIYAITPDGLKEFSIHRDAALREVRIYPDPVDLALQNTWDMPENMLRAVLEDRRHAMLTQLDAWRHLQETAQPFISHLESVIFRHTELRMEAELTWHDELLKQLDRRISGETTHSDENGGGEPVAEG